jgi:uncharacterized membrane protein
MDADRLELTVRPFLTNCCATLADAERTFTLTLTAEQLLQEVALLLKVVLEFIAIAIVAIALVKTLQTLVHSYRGRQRLQMTQQSTRLQLGLSLALSLEFLLAADIVGTAVSPSWDAIAKLAAITGIRTFLNFFLHLEVQELQKNPPVSDDRP